MNKLNTVFIFVLCIVCSFVIAYSQGVTAGKQAYNPENSVCWVDNEYIILGTPDGNWWNFQYRTQECNNYMD